MKAKKTPAFVGGLIGVTVVMVAGAHDFFWGLIEHNIYVGLSIAITFTVSLAMLMRVSLVLRTEDKANEWLAAWTREKGGDPEEKEVPAAIRASARWRLVRELGSAFSRTEVHRGYEAYRENLLAMWDIPNFFTGTLIALGLLGTFVGMLQSVGSITDLFTEISKSPDKISPLTMFAAVKAPLLGMGTSFSASMLGLACSLYVGIIALLLRKSGKQFLDAVRRDLQDYVPDSAWSANSPLSDVALGPAVMRLSDLQSDLHRQIAAVLESNHQTVRTTLALTKHLEEQLAREAEQRAAQQEMAAALVDMRDILGRTAVADDELRASLVQLTGQIVLRAEFASQIGPALAEIRQEVVRRSRTESDLETRSVQTLERMGTALGDLVGVVAAQRDRSAAELTAAATALKEAARMAPQSAPMHVPGQAIPPELAKEIKSGFWNMQSQLDQLIAQLQAARLSFVADIRNEVRLLAHVLATTGTKPNGAARDAGAAE